MTSQYHREHCTECNKETVHVNVGVCTEHIKRIPENAPCFCRKCRQTKQTEDMFAATLWPDGTYRGMCNNCKEILLSCDSLY